MSIVLNSCNAFAIAYLDDILIFSETFEEHMFHLNTIFEKLSQNGLKLKLKKLVSYKLKLIILDLSLMRMALSKIKRKLKQLELCQCQLV